MTKFYTMKGGKKSVKGHTYEQVVGTRAQVYHGNAFHTKGGLTKKNLMINKRGRIVSRRKHASAKRERRLERAGYRTKKGVFGFIKTDEITKHRSRSRSRKNSRGRPFCAGRKHKKGCRHRRSLSGGNGVNYALTPSKFDGHGVGTSGVDLQFVAGNATS